MYDRPSMDEDEFATAFDSVEHKPKQKDRNRCLCDIHVNSAAVSIFFTKITISIAFIIRNLHVKEYTAAGFLIVYVLTILLALIGYQCTQPALFFLFIIADIIVNVLFGLFVAGLLLIGRKLLEATKLMSSAYSLIPFWFCMLSTILFFINVYALHIVLRCRHHLKHKLQKRHLPRTIDHPSTADSMPEIP
ncbi:hypothetical protein M3Y98_01053200 [Aphelenchoides besseyi]|nr:hypothetical protein M3Y98_01053200 [Aphelenchoides besseyi]KAI6209777.1 hypothetical protein M3Y96_00256600 [Aphelenchoides besseyi]